MGIDKIQILSSIEAIRKRPGMYVGDLTATTLPNELAKQLLCHALDEAASGRCTRLWAHIRPHYIMVKYDAPMSFEMLGDKTKAEVMLTEIGACHNLKENMSVGDDYCTLGLAVLTAFCGFAHMDVNEEAGQTPEEAFDEYDLTFHFQRDVIFLTRSLYDRQWTEEDVANPPSEVQVGFRIYKSWTVGGATRATHVSLPLQERAGFERVPVHLPEDCRDLLREARQLNLDIHSLCGQRDELHAQIQDTGNIEKKVLAALTQKTLALNPELMNQIGDIVGTVEGTLPLLAAAGS